MRAAKFIQEGNLQILDVSVPAVGPNQVRIEVEACSICGTDVHILSVPAGYAATPGTTLGHEFCGIIVEKGQNVHHLDLGERVVVNPNNYCGTCRYCQKNLPNHCQNIEALGIDYDGAFAQYCVVDEKVVYPISKAVPKEIAACCEPLACAVNGLRKVQIIPGCSAVVIGAGPIGVMMAMLLKASGVAQLYIVETSPWRREFAQTLGLGTVVDPIEKDIKTSIIQETGIGADLVFDMTGSQGKLALELLRKGGEAVYFGVNQQAHWEFSQSIATQKEITIHGTWLANATFPDAIRILEKELNDIRPLITETVTLDHLMDSIRKLSEGKAMKIIVLP